MVKRITAQAKKAKDVYTKETNAHGLMLMLEMMKLSMEMDLLKTIHLVLLEPQIVKVQLWKKEMKVIFAQTLQLKMSAIMMVVAGATGIMKHANQLLKKMKLSMEKVMIQLNQQ